MRTKTLALSAVLGLLGSTSLFAQNNVYSINAVGYINVTIPAGFSIITCPLICSPDNTLNTVLPNVAANGYAYANCSVDTFNNGAGFGGAPSDFGNPGSFSGGWANGGSTVVLNPGVGAFFYNPGPGTVAATFVGTVPQGTALNNVLVPGYNLVGSIVPTSGDLVTSTITAFNAATYPASGDFVDFFNPNTQLYANPPGYTFGNWSGSASPYTVASGPNAGHPQTLSVTQGFFYYNAGANGVPAGTYPAGTEVWVENFSINP